MLNLPENFETFSEARKNGFMKIMEMKERADFKDLPVAA